MALLDFLFRAPLNDLVLCCHKHDGDEDDERGDVGKVTVHGYSPSALAAPFLGDYARVVRLCMPRASLT